jgi:hypothetical protein
LIKIGGIAYNKKTYNNEDGIVTKIKILVSDTIVHTN